MADQKNTPPASQSGGDRNWEKTADRVADTPEATGKEGRGAPARTLQGGRGERPVRTEHDRNVKE